MDSSNIDRGGESVQTPENVRDQLQPASHRGSTNAFRALWEGGYRRLVPIVPPDAELSPHSSLFNRPACRGKAVGELGPHGWRGMNWHTHVTTEADLERWGAMGAGVGVRTGEGLIGIDADTLAPELADLVLQAALEILGPAPRRRL